MRLWLVALLVALAAGAAVALALLAGCAQRDACVADGTCVPLEGCSFATVSAAVSSVAYDPIYTNVTVVGYAAALRGVCAPGERQAWSPARESVFCSPFHPWPDAVNHEIKDAAGAAEHEQACGAWIGAAEEYFRYWAFAADGLYTDAVKEAEKAAFQFGSNSGSPAAKLHLACVHASLAGAPALLADAKEAFAELAAAVGGVVDRASALRAAGALASFYCDGPVQLGLYLGGASLWARATAGTPPPADKIGSALQALGTDPAPAVAAAAAVAAGGAAAVTVSDYELVYQGALNRSDSDGVTLYYDATPDLNALAALAVTDPAAAQAYLEGAAAVCVFSIREGLDPSIGGVASAAPAPALGRISSPEQTLLREANASDYEQAGRVTWTALQPATDDDVEEQCARLVRFALPDAIDSIRFYAIVSSEFEDRLRSLVETVREAVMAAAALPVFTAVLADANAVVQAVDRTRIRIPGALAGTTFGSAVPDPSADVDSAAGPIRMALRETHALFQQRTSQMLWDGLPVCDAPAIYDSLTSNAYLIPSADCSALLLGLLKRPFADEAYDDVSLVLRVGYIVAHELAHQTFQTSWDSTAIADLLQDYDSSTYSEAIADVLGVYAIVHAGLATVEEACTHVSQLWCARVAAGVTFTGVHPAPNLRGNALCSTMRRLLPNS